MKNPKARIHYAVSGVNVGNPAVRAGGLLNIANQFLTAGKRVPAGTCDWPKYFLLYHAIEAALKAYLARSGMTDKKLQELGHDIKRIADKAEQRGFTLHADEKTVLNGFEGGDLPSVAMRYEYFGSPSCPTFDNLTHVAEAIVSRA